VAGPTLHRGLAARRAPGAPDSAVETLEKTKVPIMLRTLRSPNTFPTGPACPVSQAPGPRGGSRIWPVALLCFPLAGTLIVNGFVQARWGRIPTPPIPLPSLLPWSGDLQGQIAPCAETKPSCRPHPNKELLVADFAGNEPHERNPEAIRKDFSGNSGVQAAWR